MREDKEREIGRTCATSPFHSRQLVIYIRGSSSFVNDKIQNNNNNSIIIASEIVMHSVTRTRHKRREEKWGGFQFCTKCIHRDSVGERSEKQLS